MVSKGQLHRLQPCCGKRPCESIMVVVRRQAARALDIGVVTAVSNFLVCFRIPETLIVKVIRGWGLSATGLAYLTAARTVEVHSANVMTELSIGVFGLTTFCCGFCAVSCYGVHGRCLHGAVGGPTPSPFA